jgi:shikimate kinase
VGERLVLVGMMGAGKSTAGRLAAHRLGWRFVDVDEEVCDRAGCSVAELFAQRGEAAFRGLESECLAAAMGGQGDAVVSVGGGAVLDPANRRLLGGGATVVWLRASPATLAARVAGGGGRPLLAVAGQTPESVLVELARERAGLYAEVADVVIDVDGLDPELVADRLCSAVVAP